MATKDTLFTVKIDGKEVADVHDVDLRLSLSGGLTNRVPDALYVTISRDAGEDSCLAAFRNITQGGKNAEKSGAKRIVKSEVQFRDQHFADHFKLTMNESFVSQWSLNEGAGGSVPGGSTKVIEQFQINASEWDISGQVKFPKIPNFK
jgi:hypothetical protein